MNVSLLDPATESESPATISRDYFGTEHLRRDLRGRALAGASVTFIAQLCSFGLGIAGTVILARLLTPRDFGLVTMVLAFSLLLQNFGVNGFIEATIQKENLNHEHVNALFWVNAAINLGLALLFMASAPLLVWFYKEPLLGPIVVGIAVSILFSGLSTQQQALLRRNMEFRKVAVTDVGATLASLAVAIVLARLGWGYWALVARWVAVPVVTTVLAWVLCEWRPGLPVRTEGVGPMLRFAFNTYGNFVLFYVGKTVDKILVGRLQGSQALGSYDRAYQLSTTLPSQALTPLNSVAMSVFSRLADNPPKYRHTYVAMLSIFSFVSMPASAVLALTGNDLILFVLGPQWASSGPIFSVFGLSIGMLVMYHTHAWLHLSLGTPERWLRWSIVSLVVTVLLIVGGLQFGPIGVAAGYSASLYILTPPALWYAGRPVGLKVSSVVSGVWKYFVSALAAGLICRFIMTKYGLMAHANHLPRIIVTSVLCTAIYLLLIVALYGGVRPISQFIRVLREMIRGVSSGSGPDPISVDKLTTVV